MDYYSVLGVRPDSTPQEIRAGYRKLSRAIHPDKQPSHLQEAAKEVFERVEHAKAVLLDPVQRSVFDNFGEAGMHLLHTHPSTLNSRFTEKIKKLIQASKESQERGEFNPRSAVVFELSCSDFVDYAEREFSDLALPWHSRITMNAFKLQQLVKVNLGSRLAGDLGFLVYTADGFGVTNLTPRLYWSFGEACSAFLSVQLGDRKATTFSVNKAWDSL